MFKSGIGMGAALDTSVLRGPRHHKARVINVFGKRLILTDDPGDSTLLSREVFSTDLVAHHFDGDGRHVHSHDLGSGLVTNVGVMALANDFAWAQNCQTLKLANFHASGTGTTAAAATDIALQTLAAPTTTTAVTGSRTGSRC